MPDVPWRVTSAVVALAVAAGLAIELVAETRVQSAREATFVAGQRGLPAPERRRALDNLEAGQHWRPGTEALTTEAYVLLRAGDRGGAERAACEAVRREPEDAQVWRTLAAVLEAARSPGAAAAAARAHRLDPRG